ncbi:hypothetical protein QAD02_001323 [Eretmocerus hayati]|uniref:Uncharacterized protein n=1 Tax=Eretmocerus hayati TaxID=131215 RepID=A0ACC2NG42_9HYME|nr:hypothetical protein QAD02_001323 [Eretmocerus hayati]
MCTCERMSPPVGWEVKELHGDDFNEGITQATMQDRNASAGEPADMTTKMIMMLSCHARNSPESGADRPIDGNPRSPNSGKIRMSSADGCSAPGKRNDLQQK